MNILNHTPFQVQAMPFEGPGHSTVLAVIVKGTFDFCQEEPAPISAQQIPIAYGDELYDDKEGGSVKFESDIVPHKPKTDIVLVGRAYSPKGKLVQILDVLLRVGKTKKMLRVIGDRTWRHSGSLLSDYPSAPQPFSVMELVYERAFGGIDPEGSGFCRENLIGRGYFVKKSKKTFDGSRLPNIEDPKNLIKSWKDHPKPVGFGFYGKAWMPRSGYLGTYNEKWRKERSPRLPEDFRAEYYNAAHPDLQVEDRLRGDEDVELINLTPEGKNHFYLPKRQPNCIVSKASPEEVKLSLDTLCLIPDENRFYLVWRGTCPVNDLTATEVETITVT